MNIKLLFIILSTLVPEIAMAQVLPPGVTFEPSTKINVEVLVGTITLQDDKIVFAYKVCSNQDSKQNVDLVAFELSELPSQVGSPLNWFSPDAQTFRVDAGRKGATNTKIYYWLSDDKSEFDIKPGQCLEGFSLKSDKLPGIKQYFAQGNSPTLFPTLLNGELTEEEEEQVGDIGNFFINSVSSKTVLPDVEASTSPVVLIDRLISLKHQAAQLGWIYGPGADGLLNSLDVKLEAAKKSILGNKNKAASNQLKAFVTEVEALHHKKIDDNAYYLLKVNAEFVISGL